MPGILQSFSDAMVTAGIHPFYIYAAAIWLLLLAARSWHWRSPKYAHCETCGHAGAARNVVPGEPCR